MNKLEAHIKFPISIDSNSGALAAEHDYDAYVKQLMKQVLLTNQGERVNRPDFGCGLRQMVFMPLNEATSSLTQVTIYQALEKWIGSLIIVNEVEVKSQESTLYIEINYTIRSRGEKRYLNLEVNY